MNTLKQFFGSKINWTAIVLILVSLQDAIANLDITQMTAKGWITFSLGILIIILRTYFTATAIKMVALVFVMSFGLSGCVSMNSAINWAKKNGTVTQTTAANGVVTTTAKVQGFYNPTKIKEKFSKFLVEFNAILPSLTVTTATKDTTTPIITPTFKK
jgi:uncharacterized protein YceK